VNNCQRDYGVKVTPKVYAKKLKKTDYDDDFDDDDYSKLRSTKYLGTKIRYKLIGKKRDKIQNNKEKLSSDVC